MLVQVDQVDLQVQRMLVLDHQEVQDHQVVLEVLDLVDQRDHQD